MMYSGVLSDAACDGVREVLIVAYLEAFDRAYGLSGSICNGSDLFGSRKQFF